LCVQMCRTMIPKYAFHAGSINSANIELLNKHRWERDTGNLGTGLYVYLNAQEVFWEKGNTVYVFKNPWRNPFILETMDDFEIFLNFSKGLNNIFKMPNSISDSERVEQCLGDNVKYFEERLKARKTRIIQAACQALMLSHKSFDDNPSLGAIQPFTLMLTHFGFDGILNFVVDTNTFGSIIFDTTTLVPIVYTSKAKNYISFIQPDKSYDCADYFGKMKTLSGGSHLRVSGARKVRKQDVKANSRVRKQ